MQLELHAYSPWNGYDSLAEVIDSAALYKMGEWEADQKSFTSIADAIEIATIATVQMVGISPAPRFVLMCGGNTMEITDDQPLDKAFEELVG